MSTFKFGEIRVDVHRTGPDPLHPYSDFYTVRISHEDAFIETLAKTPRASRSSGSDFMLAAESLYGMMQPAMNPEVWAAEMQSVGRMSQEEIDGVTYVASKLAPYMSEAIESSRGRMELYSEHREGTPGPLEMGIARKLQLPDVIKTPEDIAEFFAHLYLVDRVQFHPDDRFVNYVDEKGRPAFTPDEILVRDRLMAEAFATSALYGLDLYELGLWVGALTGHLPDAESEAKAPGWLKALSNGWI
jgi:hypothetical protein